MGDGPGILFVQRRAHKAGAQGSLGRVLTHPAMRALNPWLLTSADGWLVSHCREHGIPVLIEPFPSSRSLPARLMGNRLFAGRVAAKLHERGFSPRIVHANDHLEGLLALRLASALHARTAMFLRSPFMTERDYFKYRCREFDFLSAVGEELLDRARSWDPEKTIALTHNGLYVDEFAPPAEKVPRFPRRILVVGASLDWKGWADLTDALHLLALRGRSVVDQVDFTGDEPDPALNDLRLDRLGGAIRFHFLGRREDFRRLITEYGLVVNPTRGESFGMAAVEVLAAGIPLLTSRTGIIEQVLEAEHMLFRPHDPEDLANALDRLERDWPRLDPGVAQSQQNLRLKFDINRTVERLLNAYSQLLGR